MAKADLLSEAAELGVIFPSDEEPPTNRVIQEAIDAANAAEDAEEAGEVTTNVVQSEPEVESEVPEVPAEEVAVEEEAVEVAPEDQEPVFQVAQFKAHAESIFGVGYHVLVGAVSAGIIPAGKVTKAQVAAGIEQYLNTPVEPKEGE